MRRFFSHISLLLSFITIGVHSHACICPHPNTLEQNIHDHAFIAHVRIVEKIYSNDTVRNGEIVQIKKTHQGYLKFEIIELFKGDTLSTIKQYDISTSCDIGIYPGEEWILFVWYNSKTNIYSVGACSPSSKFRNAKGERDWRWGIPMR